jgi:SAM-dependent methyltransferase/uncharacterized membrane protein YbhN (UPF0104 family)
VKSTIEMTQVAAHARPPRSIAWVLLAVSGLAVLLTGLLATGVVITQRGGSVAITPGFWVGLLVAGLFTLASLGLRALRWVFLLRRAEARIPIRDAYIGYLSGFALLLVPLFLGETVLRAWVLRRRGGVPSGITAVLNLWERWLDLLALAFVWGTLWLGKGELTGVVALMLPVAFLCSRSLRVWCLRWLIGGVNRAGRATGGRVVPELRRLGQTRTWSAAFLTSVVAWILPGFGLWTLVAGGGWSLSPADSALSFVTATLLGGTRLAPAGVVVTGGQLLVDLTAHRVPEDAAVMLVLGIRFATAGLAIALGALFALIHLRSPQTIVSDHFDAIADAYDVQIAEERREALLTRKTALMRDCLRRHGAAARGLDVGCGQGWYVRRMRELGYDVTGIDASAGQVALGRAHLGNPALVHLGSALAIPAGAGSLDFVYTINVLHHLPSPEAQRDAFAELLRVLRPGGLLFLHEINTTNPLFRFYMGYVFPSLNCIDEGIERWLLPRELHTYTDAPLIEVQYFTFFPDFMPERLVRLCAPIERWLERSFFRSYSAHYMAVLRKPA